MDYPPSRSVPWTHQVELWNLAKNKNAFYVAHDMGCGKTKSAIDYLNGIDAHRVLIICPKKVIEQWPYQFAQHSASLYTTLPLVKGSTKEKAHKLNRFLKLHEKNGRHHAVILNYESFWLPPLGPVYNDKNRITDYGELMSHQWDVLIADEAHRIKSPGGKASWGLMRIASKAERKLFLSGTPMPHSPMDIYAQYRALDPSIFGRSFARFKNQYCIMGGYGGHQIVNFKNLEDLNQRFYSIAHHVTADDTLDLPDKVDIDLRFNLEPKTIKIYQELERDFISQVEAGEITVQNALEKLLRLAQITSGIVKLDDGHEEVVESNKIDTAIELVRDIDPKEPIVIFCRFTKELRWLIKELTMVGRHPCEISGRKDEQGLFLSKQADTAVVQIQAGCEGLDTLKRARYCIYLSKGFSLGQYRQSRHRVWRPGQTRKVFYYHIIAKHTIDEKIMAAIKAKQKIVDYVLAEIKPSLKTGTNN